MKNLPKINKKYNCFDDGKIHESRRYKVIIKEIIPFDKIDNKTLVKWRTEVEQCYWLYNKVTDFFLKSTDKDGEENYFVRTIGNGWFSIGGFLNCGRLDVDGELTKLLKRV